MKVLLFDMGGVLVELTGLLDMVRWMKEPVSGEDLIVRWIHSPAVTLFETGRISPEEFSVRTVGEFGLEISPDTFCKAFGDFIGDFTDGIRQVLLSIPGDYKKALLTNTNVIHWDKVHGYSDFLPLFDAVFPSHLTGVIKPEPRSFLQVAEHFGCEPGEIIFFDDNPVNIRAALSLGLKAETVARPDELASVLASLKIIPE
jgi:putative hydrolase of the HAD superfamily